MDWNIESVLVLSAHTDDMELGAGGLIRKLVENGVRVKSIVFSDCQKSVDTSRYPLDILRKECLAAAEHLGITDVTIHEFEVREFPHDRQLILEEIYSARKETHYDLVLSPWQGDLHQDHRIVAEEALRAFMKTDTSILAYPIPGNCPGFIPQVYFPLNEDDIAMKIEMLRKYESQVSRRDYFEIHAIKGLMNYYGLHICKDYAEAFIQERGVVNNVGLRSR